MSEFLYHYHPVEPATWFYLSSLLAIGLFFKFSRFWSVRNLDLLLLIALGPGLLFIHYGRKLETQASRVAAVAEVGERNAEGGEAATVERRSAEAGLGTNSTATATDPRVDRPTDLNGATNELASGTTAPASDEGLPRGRRVQWYGYLWLFGGGLLWVIRLLADPTMVRRPLLEPNLSAGGLTFIGCSLFVFLMANVISRPAAETNAGAGPSVAHDETQERVDRQMLNDDGPGYALLARLPVPASKALAISAHLAIVMGMVLIGYWHFDNIIMGIGGATLYLMLPYTALMTNEIKHVLPAASLVWAVLLFRRPLASGAFLGLAGGMSYYPLFLLPLWLSFYWSRGLLRFIIGVLVVLIVLLFVLFSSPDVFSNVRLMFGLRPPVMENLRGLWDPELGGWSGWYRIPVLVTFLVLVSSMTLWPAQKNLGTLLSCSSAIMVATQFWHGFGGGTYMAWYLPLLLMTVFRPNLEDRVALTVLAEGWLPRRTSVSPTST